MESDETAGPKENKEEPATIERKVFDKIFGFPHWPAKILTIQEGLISVVFQDGQKGEHLEKILKNGKFKKTGPTPKLSF